MSWFKIVINYTKRDKRGKSSAKSEQFLFDGILYGEVEKMLFERMEGRVTDFKHTILRIGFDAVYDYTQNGDFYKVTIEEYHEKKGKQEIKTFHHLVVANSCDQAETRALSFIGKTEIKTVIQGSERTRILGVWHPKIDGWKDDFIARMTALLNDGQETGDKAQTTMFDREGNVKKYGPTPDPMNGADEPADIMGTQPAPLESETHFQKAMRETQAHADEVARVTGLYGTPGTADEVGRLLDDSTLVDNPAALEHEETGEELADMITRPVSDELLDEENEGVEVDDAGYSADQSDATETDDEFDQGPPNINQDEVERFNGMMHKENAIAAQAAKEPRQRGPKGTFLPRLTTQAENGTPDPQ